MAGIAAVNTTLAASSALMTGLFLTKFMEKSYNMWQVLNSTLAGLVAITAACATVGPGPAIGIGVLAAFAYHFTNMLILSRGIDDVVGAFSVHGTPGAVGLICTGLFSRQDYIDLAFGPGLISYSPGRQLGVQLLQVLCTVCWSVSSSALVLFILTRTIGIRVSSDDEIVGLDFVLHQGYAYETHNKRMLRAKKQIEREQILGQKLRRAVNNVGGGSGGGGADKNGPVSSIGSRNSHQLFKEPTHHGHGQHGGQQQMSINDVSLHGKKSATRGGGTGVGSGLNSMVGGQGGIQSVVDTHHTATHVAIHVHADDDARLFNSEESESSTLSSDQGALSPDQSRIRSQLRVSAAQHMAAQNHDAFHASTSGRFDAASPTAAHRLLAVAALSASPEAPNQSIPDDMPGAVSPNGSFQHLNPTITSTTSNRGSYNTMTSRSNVQATRSGRWSGGMKTTNGIVHIPSRSPAATPNLALRERLTPGQQQPLQQQPQVTQHSSSMSDSLAAGTFAQLLSSPSEPTGGSAETTVNTTEKRRSGESTGTTPSNRRTVESTTFEQQLSSDAQELAGTLHQRTTSQESAVDLLFRPFSHGRVGSQDADTDPNEGGPVFHQEIPENTPTAAPLGASAAFTSPAVPPIAVSNFQFRFVGVNSSAGGGTAPQGSAQQPTSIQEETDGSLTPQNR